MKKVLLFTSLFTLVATATIFDNSGASSRVDGRGVGSGYGSEVEIAFTHIADRLNALIATNPAIGGELDEDCNDECLDMEQLQALRAENGRVRIVDTATTGLFKGKVTEGEAVYLDVTKWNKEYLLREDSASLIIYKLLTSSNHSDPNRRLSDRLAKLLQAAEAKQNRAAGNQKPLNGI